MKRKVFALIAISFALFVTQTRVFAAGAGENGVSHGLDPLVLVGVALILMVAKIGGEVFERIGQPAVLGELIAGIFVGNLVIFGFAAAETLKTNSSA